MPNNSLYEITKTSIEQGIQQLQEKIRRRKQLQLQKEIQNTIIKSDQLYQYQLELNQLQNVYENAKYDHVITHAPLSYSIPTPLPYVLQPPIPYSQSFFMQDSIKYAPHVDWTYEQLKDKIKRQAVNLDYLRKLQRIKQQSLFIDDRLSTINKASFNNTINYDRPMYVNHNLNRQLRQLEYQRQLLQAQKIISPLKTQQQLLMHKDIVREIKRGSPIRQMNSNTSFHQQSLNHSRDPYSVLQYDQNDPKSQDSSLLVDKYYRGIRAQQYNRDMKRLALIQEKLKLVEEKQQYYKPEIDGSKFGSRIPTGNNNSSEIRSLQQTIYNRSPDRYQKTFQTPQQGKSSRKKDNQKTKEKNTIPIIKQDLQQGDQTVVNTVNKNTNRSSINRNSKVKKHLNTSQFANQKLKQIINSQKKELLPDYKHNQQKIVKDFKKTYLDEGQGKNSSARKQSKAKINKLRSTIDVSTLEYTRKGHSPIRNIHQVNDNPYLLKNQSSKKKNNNRSLTSRYDIKNKNRSKSSYIRNASKQRKDVQRSNSHNKSLDRNNRSQNIQNMNKSQNLVNRYPQRHQQILNQQQQNQAPIKRSRQICIPAPLYPASQQIQYHQSQLDHIRKLCNQKIQKRLQISTIVFKDSKLRNQKHEMDHLFSKFQNQIKGRKEVRDKINTNPRILRKHKMVVEKITI